MSSAHTVSPLLQAGRRFHVRRRIEGLAYVEFGPENGAILIDVGEGGLGFQSVMPVTMNQAVLFKFKLPAKSAYIEGFAEVAWVNESGKGGGLRFVELAADVCKEIREWTGVLSAPEARAVPAGNVASNPPQERVTEQAPDLPVQTSTISDTKEKREAPAEIEGLPQAKSENTQISGVDLEANPASSADTSDDSGEVASEEAPAQQNTLPEASAIPEFTIEVAAASDAALTPATQAPWSTPIAAANPAVTASRPPHSTNRTLARAVGASETILPATATPATPAPAATEKIFVPTQKIPQKRASSKPEAHPAAAYPQDTAVPASFVRQPQKPVPPTTSWENMLANDDELQPKAKLAPQALKIGIGATAGACLVLVLVALVPSLRTRVQVTANAKAGAPILPSASAFQIEVADLNNRRWILRSGGDAGSPFSDTPSRRDTQSAASSRADSKSSRADDSEDSADKASAPQPKPRRPAQLALSRPRTNATGVASAQLVAPSIFDGITPPIGSVSDRLASGGPAAPGIVQPETQPSVRTSALQAAVLEQRVAPIYPSIAMAARVEGDVLVNATIGTDGVPRNLKVIRGDQRLVPAALTAIGQWHYRPATLGARPIETQIVITVTFQLR